MSNYTRKAMAEARHRLRYRPVALAQSDAKQCPACGSSSPHIHPAMQADGGEVELCSDAFHLRETPQNRKEYIEAVKRKRAALAQSDAEPVGRPPGLPFGWNDPFHKNYLGEDVVAANSRKPVTAPPRPAASAGLIEAAEVVAEAERYANFYAPNSDGYNTFMVFASKFRACAADRSKP